MMKKIIAVICVITALYGCSESEKTPPEPESRPVKYLSVHVGDYDNYRSFPGIVESGDKAVLAFRISGKLASIDVRPGAAVVKGQRLATLEQDQFLLQLEQAKANYELTLVQFKRDKKLYKTNVISELDYDTSIAKLNQAKAALEKQEVNVRYSTLIAPYTGKLSLLLKENHEYLVAKQPVMHIQSAGVLNMTFQLPEQLVSSLKNTREIETRVIFDTLPGEIYNARFKEIDTEANQATSSYTTTIYLERPDGRNIVPGMSGLVKIKLPLNIIPGIPEQAIMRRNGKTFIWFIDKNNTTHNREVVLDDGNRIISGLNTGDNIAISGVNELSEGQKVRAWIKERGL